MSSRSIAIAALGGLALRTGAVERCAGAAEDAQALRRRWGLKRERRLHPETY